MGHPMVGTARIEALREALRGAERLREVWRRRDLRRWAREERGVPGWRRCVGCGGENINPEGPLG